MDIEKLVNELEAEFPYDGDKSGIDIKVIDEESHEGTKADDVEPATDDTDAKQSSDGKGDQLSVTDQPEAAVELADDADLGKTIDFIKRKYSGDEQKQLIALANSHLEHRKLKEENKRFKEEVEFLKALPKEEKQEKDSDKPVVLELDKKIEDLSYKISAIKDIIEESDDPERIKAAKVALEIAESERIDLSLEKYESRKRRAEEEITNKQALETQLVLKEHPEIRGLTEEERNLFVNDIIEYKQTKGSSMPLWEVGYVVKARYARTNKNLFYKLNNIEGPEMRSAPVSEETQSDPLQDSPIAASTASGAKKSKGLPKMINGVKVAEMLKSGDFTESDVQYFVKTGEDIVW